MNDAQAMKCEQVIEQIRALSTREAMVELIDKAHAPRPHPDYPGVQVERQEPTAYIEGYTDALLKVNSIINAAEFRAKRNTEAAHAE